MRKILALAILPALLLSGCSILTSGSYMDEKATKENLEDWKYAMGLKDLSENERLFYEAAIARAESMNKIASRKESE